jgi:hypothetical protein
VRGCPQFLNACYEMQICWSCTVGTASTADSLCLLNKDDTHHNYSPLDDIQRKNSIGILF